MEERAECDGESSQEPDEVVQMGMDRDREIYGRKRFKEGDDQMKWINKAICK